MKSIIFGALILSALTAAGAYVLVANVSDSSASHSTLGNEGQRWRLP